MAQHVVVVGGGLAGLAAAIFLARGGRKVTVFDRRAHLGGRAVTEIRHGFRFNLGPHALYRRGAAASVCRELGIPVRGGVPARAGTALLGGERYRLPLTPLSVASTSLLSFSAKLEAVGLLFRLASLDTRAAEGATVREWSEQNVRDPMLRSLFLSLCRVVTYSGDERQSAKVALDQIKLAMRGVLYVHEGWQRIVDSMHASAVAAGVNFVTSARVVRIDADGRVRGVEIGGLDGETALREGAHIAAETVVLAVDPITAASLLPGLPVAETWRALQPVALTSLDVGLSRLPDPEQTFAIGIDRPYYFSVHSRWAQLTPRGGALIHVAKYRSDPVPGSDAGYDGEMIRLNEESRRDEAELEGVLDDLQPGWREVVVHRRFIPSIVVANAMAAPPGERPHPITPIQGLYLAGDWVGREGVLADAALASARDAARAILSATH